MKIRDLWKWILNRETNQELSNLCVGIGATIQGFRNNRVTNQNRHVVIQNLLTPKSMSRLCQCMSIDEDGEEIAKESIVELRTRLEEYSPEGILKALLVKGESEKALALFSFINEKQLEVKEEMMEEQSLVDENSKEESKLKKLEKKIQKLKKHNEVEIVRLREKVNSLHGENERLHKLQQQHAGEKSELNQILSDLKEENSRLENEKTFYKKKIEEYKQQQSRLHAKIAHLEAQEKGQEENEIENSECKRIALIGDPKNEGIYDYQKHVIKIVDGINLHEIEEEGKFDEIWLLTYKVPITRQKKMQRNDIVRIENFSQLVEKLSEMGGRK